MGHHVTATFGDPEAAERAVQALMEGHFAADEISILVADSEGRHEEIVEHDTGVAEGVAGGVAAGAVLGALGATLVATGVVAAPGLTLLATGPLLAALKGAAAGAAAGLEIGALAGLGFWKDEAHIHAKALEAGGIVVGVPADHERADHAREVLRDAGADQVQG